MRQLLLTLLLLTLPAFAQDAAKPKLNLVGDRFPGLTYEELNPAQKVIADRALAGRGAIGIFNITLRSPELSDAMRGIIGSRIPPVISAKQNELAILLAARYWNWSVGSPVPRARKRCSPAACFRSTRRRPSSGRALWQRGRRPGDRGTRLT